MKRPVQDAALMGMLVSCFFGLGPASYLSVLPIMQSYKSIKGLIFWLGLLIQLLLEILSDIPEIYSINLINIFNPIQLTITVTYARTGDTWLLA